MTEDQQAAVHPERLDTIKARMRDAFVDDEGRPPADEEVAAVVEEKAARYGDAPIQDFTTLLTEHDARDALRQRGLHPRLGEERDQSDGALAEGEATEAGGESREATVASSGAARIAPLGGPTGGSAGGSPSPPDHEVEGG